MSYEQDARRELISRLRGVYSQRGGYRIAGAPPPPAGMTAEQKRVRRNQLAAARRAGLKEKVREVNRRPLKDLTAAELREHRNKLARERRIRRAELGIQPVRRRVAPPSAAYEAFLAEQGVSMKKPRKPRKPASQRTKITRELNPGASRWVDFVRMWRARPENEGQSYKEALKAASSEWRELSTAQRAQIVGYGMSGGRRRVRRARQARRRGGVLVGEQNYNSGGVLIDQFYRNTGLSGSGGVLIDQFYN